MELLNKKKKENNSATIKWIYKRSKKYLPGIVVISLIAVLSSLSYIALALVSKEVIDIATGIKEGRMLYYGIAVFAIILLQNILIGSNSLLNTYVTGKFTISMREYLFKVIASKKYSFITGYHSGDLLNRLTSDADVVISNIVHIIPNVMSMIAKIVGGMSALIILDKRVALIILCFGIIVPALGRVINRKFKSLHKKCQAAEGKTRSFMQECFENIVVIKTFQSQVPFVNRLDRFLKENFRLKIKRGLLSLLTHLSLYAFFTVGYYSVLLWGAGGIAKGVLTYGTLTAFLQLFEQLRAPMQNISAIVPQYYSAIASAERLIEVENGLDDKPADRELLLSAKNNFKEIKVNDVTFAYGDELILENCSFTAEKGKITAITGESGSGKSTIFRIILGLYEPQGGNITVNENTVLDTALRGLFAYVPQGNMVLSGTVRENITLCNEDVSEEELIRVAKAADIYDIIKALPDGFDTVLTERGGGLSEGQIQRISLARALLTDAPVLLLDEATSALDEETETKVLSNIKALNDKTILFVTHRNTSLKVCDKIVRVENKKFQVIKE